MRSQRTFHTVAIIFALFVLSACAPKVREQRVVWPAPPDRPRLEWIKNYYSQDDFPKTGMQAAKSWPMTCAAFSKGSQSWPDDWGWSSAACAGVAAIPVQPSP